MDDSYFPLIKKIITYSNISTSVIGLACNLYSLSYYIRRRQELGNAFLAYLNIADAIECLSVLMGHSLYSRFFSDRHEGEFYQEISLAAFVTAVHVSRCSVTVTGTITIYLNVLRTSVIIWPMVRFKKRLLHASLIVLIAVFVVMEVTFGVYFSYPHIDYHLKTLLGANLTQPRPFDTDDPIRIAVNHFPLWIGVPIIVAVIVCCIASTAKLLICRDKNLNENDQITSRSRRRAAITVLILSVQYVFLNSVALTFLGLEYYFDHAVENGDSTVKVRVDQNILLGLGTSAIHLNSILNPIVYIWRVKNLREPLSKMKLMLFCRGESETEVETTVIVNSSHIRHTSV